MFLALARPELLDVRPGWGSRLVRGTTLQLEPLSPPEARRMTMEIMGAFGVSAPDAVGRLVDTAEGNPLFIEELAASLG
jgi:predicted ATPase